MKTNKTMYFSLIPNDRNVQDNHAEEISYSVCKSKLLSKHRNHFVIQEPVDRQVAVFPHRPLAVAGLYLQLFSQICFKGIRLEFSEDLWFDSRVF